MKDDINSSFLNLNDNKEKINNNDIDDNDDNNYYKKFSKKDKNKKLDQFVKFKPKNSGSQNNGPSLKGAENKVKSILSSFLREMKNEEKADKYNKKNPKIKILISKLSNKKIKINHGQKYTHSNFQKNSLNSFQVFNSMINNENLTTKNGSGKDNFAKIKQDNSPHNSSNKLKNNYLNCKIQPNEEYEKNRSKYSSTLSKNIMSNFKNSNINHNYCSKIKTDNSTKNNKIDSSPKKNDNNNNNNKNYFDKKKNFLKQNSVKFFNKFQKRLILEDNNDDKKSFTNNSSMSSKNILSGSIRNTTKKKESFFKLKKENSINFKPGDNYKRKSIQNSKRDFHQNSKKKLIQVENVLKNLQEKLKNSIILRPEELDLDLNETHRRRAKKYKEKIVAKKQVKESNKNLTNIKISNKNLDDNSTKNEKDMILANSGRQSKRNSFKEKEKEKNKPKIPLPNFDLFNTSNILKNETQLALKTSSLELTASQLPFVGNTSQKDIILEKYRILTHKKMVYDSLDDDEFDDEINDFFYISPESNFSLIFDGILLLVTLYSMLSIPYYLAHSLQFCREDFFHFQRFFNIITELIYFFDLIFGFFRAYYNFEEILIKKNTSIIKKYLNGWFIFDLIGAIPFYSIIKMKEEKCNHYFSPKYYNYILNNSNYLFLCNRLLKMIKSVTCNQAYNYISNLLNEYKYYNQISLFLSISFILLNLHLTSCIYIFIGRNSYPNWIMISNLDTQSFHQIYICGIYILITALTTVGYGDITCYSFKERIFQLFLLVIGIVAYSWIVSNFSNYIQKINEQSVDLESRILILDEIKMTNPNLTKDLYDRILRHLKYKKYFEKKDKSIILESLPVTLKNNLIVEMYKPIIKNFIFFKSFQNTDFIVRVILSFKPVLALKNDILVNEGDIVEDIMFVKKGILSVELPLNILDPEENIKKYLSMPILQTRKASNGEKAGGSFLIPDRVEHFRDFENSNFMSTINKTNDEKIVVKKKKNQISYVKILNIRENEHFGDVLMFLEVRSPLRLRVRTKKAELFFLKKIDAVNISSSYQNIWKRINKKSVFNFEQIKKSIIKIVELYSSYKNIQNEEKEINQNKTKRRKTMEYLDSKMNKEKLSETEINIKRSNSHKDFPVKNEYTKLFNEQDYSESLSFNKIQSSQTLSFNFSVSKTDSIDLIDIEKSLKNKSKKLKNKNRKSLFKNTEDNNKKSCVMKSFKSLNTSEFNLIDSKIRSNTDIQRLNKKNSKTSSDIIRDNDDKIEDKLMPKHFDIKKNNKNKKKKTKKNISESSYSKESKSISSSINDNLSNDASNKELDIKFNDLSYNNQLEKESNNSYCIGSKINEEIYPGEICNEPFREELLLKKKISLSKVENKPKISNLNDNANNIENSKIKALLENTTSNVNDLTRNENRKIKIDIKNNKNNLYFNYDLIEKDNEPNKVSKTSKKIILSVESKIKIEIPSLYENIYKLSNYKYHENKQLQNKVKDLLIKKSPLIYSFSSSEGLDIKLLHSNAKINKSPLKLRKTISSTNSPKMQKSSLIKSNISINNSFNNSVLNIKKKPIKEAKRRSVFIKIPEHKHFKEKITELYHSPSFNYNPLKRQMSQISHSKISGNKLKPVLSRKQTQAAMFIAKSNNNIHGDCNKSALIINPEQNHKRKNSLLNKINLNIQKTNQNLNNPDEFYSNYFQSLLEVEKINIRKNDNLKLRKISSPKIRYKKEKNKGLKKGNTMWRLDIDHKQ